MIVADRRVLLIGKRREMKLRARPVKATV
jgi:hypothetical protein